MKNIIERFKNLFKGKKDKWHEINPVATPIRSKKYKSHRNHNTKGAFGNQGYRKVNGRLIYG